MRKYIRISFSQFLSYLKDGNKDFSYMILDDDKKADLSVHKVGELPLKGIDFKGINFRDIAVSWIGQTFTDCCFNYANLPLSIFKNCRFFGSCSFNRASVFGSVFDNAYFADGIQFINTDLRHSSFRGADFSKVNLTSSSLTGGRFNKQSDFSKSILHDATLTDLLTAGQADWTDADLSGALVTHRLYKSRFAGALLDNVRTTKKSKALKEGEKRIYFAIIGAVFDVSGKGGLKERTHSFPQLRSYALKSLDMLKIAYTLKGEDSSKVKIKKLSLSLDFKKALVSKAEFIEAIEKTV